MLSHLGLVTILSQDMPRMKAFYTELLGFEVVKEFSSPNDDFIFMHSKASGANIALQDARQGSHGVSLQAGGVLLGFAVKDADATYQDWQSKSVEIVSGVDDMGAGRIFNAKDPAGNHIQIYHLYPQTLEMQKQVDLA